MRVWTLQHQGHWPVGACSIACADSKEEAVALFTAVLQAEYGPSLTYEVDPEEFDLSKPQVKILLNGEY